MVDYLDVEDAKDLAGLRLVLTAGVPGPWGEAAKGILHVKQIAYQPVRQDAGQPNDALRDWTGHDNAPLAIYAEEAARSGWADATRPRLGSACRPARYRRRSSAVYLERGVSSTLRNSHTAPSAWISIRP